MSVELNIKENIKKYGLTINEVAERMNITRQTLGTHINGNPSVEVLARIADVIGCPITELFKQPDNDVMSITCPHCGKAINIKIETPLLDKGLLKYCKHYGKVKYESIFSGYEKKWIELFLHDKESLNDLIQYYIRSGLEHFQEYDDTPIGIKAILWNRYESHDLMPTIEGFSDWYKRQYLGFEFFFYFDGDSEIPTKYECTKEQILWSAEKMIYEEMPHLLHSENPRKEIAHYVASYIGKWNPHEQREILTVYLENVPSIKEEILKIYG